MTPIQRPFFLRTDEPTPPIGKDEPGPFPPVMPVFPRPGGGGGGSATEGLGQVNQGSQTVGTALGRAQQANRASSEAIGGGGAPRGFGPAINNFSGAMKKGGKVKAYAKGGMVSGKSKASSASSRGDGIAQRGKTKGRFV